MIKHGILYITWGIEDIKAQAEEDGREITDEQALAVLKFLDRKYDCNFGITWDTISFAIGYVTAGCL